MSLQSLIDEVQCAADEASSGKKQGHTDLLRAIHRLNLAVETPAETLSRVLYQITQVATVRMAVDIGLPGAVVCEGGKPITSSELAMKTKADRALIVRIMRVLSAMRVCDEVGEEEYRANPVTEALASPAWDGGTKYFTDTLLPVAAKITHFMQHTKFQNPETESPFQNTFGTTLWSFLAQNPTTQKNMMDYMGGRRKGGLRWPDVYPVKSQIQGTLKHKEDEILLVDVGGNQGHDLKMFAELHPDIPGRLVLMDLPEAIENNKSDMKGVEMVSYDFFTPQPVEGARLYFFRAILHDWSDERCRQILGNTVKAMENEYSRLLINEFVLPDVGCDLHPALLDITMMNLACGIERTERQWRRLLESVGLELVKIWSSPGVESVIETKRKARQ